MKGIIKEKKEICDDLYLFKIELDNSLNFKPGQFVMVSIPNYVNEKNILIKRSYSIASSTEDKLLELYIKKTGNKSFTDKLCETNINQELDILGPFGKFVYEDTDKTVYLIGAGTGIAPMMSIVRHHRDTNQKNKLLMIHGLRFCSDSPYLKELDDYKSEKFEYILAVTRDENYEGEKGRIDKEKLEKYLTDKDATIYICGMAPFAKKTKEILLELGFQNIHAELW